MFRLPFPAERARRRRGSEAGWREGWRASRHRLSMTHLRCAPRCRGSGVGRSRRYGSIRAQSAVSVGRRNAIRRHADNLRSINRTRDVVNANSVPPDGRPAAGDCKPPKRFQRTPERRAATVASSTAAGSPPGCRPIITLAEENITLGPVFASGTDEAGRCSLRYVDTCSPSHRRLFSVQSVSETNVGSAVGGRVCCMPRSEGAVCVISDTIDTSRQVSSYMLRSHLQ